MKLWVDDERPAPEGWYWVKTAAAAVACLLDQEDDPITHVSLDHDLADVHYAYFHAGMLPKDHPARAAARQESACEKTGYDVALWMAENEVWPTEEVRAHTQNPVGAKRICGVVDRYGPYKTRCVWVPATT